MVKFQTNCSGERIPDIKMLMVTRIFILRTVYVSSIGMCKHCYELFQSKFTMVIQKQIYIELAQLRWENNIVECSKLKRNSGCVSFYTLHLIKMCSKHNRVCWPISNVYIFVCKIDCNLLFNFILETCSWRTDSTRCYPGTCGKEIATSCKCLDGFGGHHCDHSKYLLVYTRNPSISFILLFVKIYELQFKTKK